MSDDERKMGREEGVYAAVRALGAYGLEDSREWLDSDEGRVYIDQQLALMHAPAPERVELTTLRLFVTALSTTLRELDHEQAQGLADMCCDVLEGRLNEPFGKQGLQ